MLTVLIVFVAYALMLGAGLAWAGLGSTPADTSRPAGRRPTRLLIVGATGGTGRQLVGQALERGFAVTALARNPSTITLTHPRLTVVRGDVLDPASLAQAMRGQDAVLSALGHKRFFFIPSRILSDGTRNILDAMHTHGVRRLVCETSLGIGGSAGRMGLYYSLFVIPVILPFYYWDKTRQERLIAGSAVEWVIVRPGALTDGAARGRYRHGHAVGSFLLTQRISRADVATFMLDQLESNEYLRSTPGVCW